MFQVAIVIFLVGSLLAGFSQNMEQLIGVPRRSRASAAAA